MKKRNIRFALILKDNVPVRNLEDLKENYDAEKLAEYFNNGMLEKWLEQRKYNAELGRLRKLVTMGYPPKNANLMYIFDFDIKQ